MVVKLVEVVMIHTFLKLLLVLSPLDSKEKLGTYLELLNQTQKRQSDMTLFMLYATSSQLPASLEASLEASYLTHNGDQRGVSQLIQVCLCFLSFDHCPCFERCNP
jgi:hypothetical protein